ncbi:MAG TPA: hypothetical protein VM144_00700 [Aestuariivirga sp.]|nr:hypothetical protein [Aestuariivirga sp.]
MTSSDNNERKALKRLADALADDILNASDEEILAEFSESCGDPNRHAVEMRALFEKTVIAASKGRLAAARAGAATISHQFSNKPVDITEARKRLRLLRSSSGVLQPITLAARNESDLSDSDVLSMCEDMCELGAPPHDDDKYGKS